MNSRLRFLIFPIAFMIWSPADAIELCAMTREEALSSAQCVRWHFACLAQGVGKPDARFASMPLKRRLEWVARAAYKLAERSCENFDYVQAKAALDARLKELAERP